MSDKSCGSINVDSWRLDYSGSIGDSIYSESNGYFEIKINYQPNILQGDKAYLHFQIDSILYNPILLGNFAKDVEISFISKITYGNHVFSIFFDAESGLSSIIIHTTHLKIISDPYLDLTQEYAKTVWSLFSGER